MKREVYDYMAGKADVYKGVKETGYEGFTKAMENGDYRKRVYEALKATGAWTYDYEIFDKSWNAPEQSAAGAGETGVVNGGGVPHVSSESQEPKTEEEVANFFANVPKQKVDDYDSSYDPMRLSLEKYQAKEDFIKSLEDAGVNSESVYAAIDAGEKDIENGWQEAQKRRNEERREDSRVPVGPNFARVEGMYEDTPAARDLSNFSLAKDLYDDARNLLDASFKGSGFGRGVWDAVYDVDAWTAGLTELGKNVQLNRVYEKAKKGEELTASEARLLDAANYYTLAGALHQAYLPSTWYSVGQGLGASVPFMLQFALTYGPASSVTKGLARAVFKKLGGGTVGRVAGESAEALTTAAVQTPLNATSIASDTYDRMMGEAEVAVDENGVPVFMGMTDQKSLGQALGEATGAQYITNLAEVSGRMLSGAGHLIKRSAPRYVQEGLKKIADNRYVRAMTDNALTRGVRKVGKPFQLGNAPEEIYEEYVEGTLNGLLIGDNDLESLYSMRSFLEIAGTVAVTQAFMGGLGAGMNHRSKRRLVKRYEKAEREYDALFSSPEERDMYVSYVNLNLNGVQGKGGKPMLTVLREAVEKMVNSKGDNFVRADGTFDTEAAKAYREEVSRVFGNYFVAKQLYDSYMAGIRTRKEADRERIATEMQEKAVNGQIMTVTLADGRRARVVSGDIVVDGDGRIDVGRSGDHFTAVYEDDGSTVQLPVEDSYTVEVVSVEDAVEAASRANDEMINREEEEAVYGPRPKLGETVTMLDSEGNRVQLVVGSEVDESGNFMAMPMEDFDNNVKGMAVAVNMSQIVRDDAASEGMDGANEGAGASLQESGEGVAGEAETESALSWIEKDAKGQPLYEKADVETAWDALVEQSEGDESIARDVAASMVKDKEAALKKMEKAPAKGATPAERIADAKVRKENIDKARAELEHWQAIAGVSQSRADGQTDGNAVQSETPQVAGDVAENPVGRSLNAEEADMLLSQMEQSAEVAPEMELTIENWDSEFGADGRVKTPIGEVKMGENQFTKLMRQGRSGKLGMVKPTLENPDIIIEDSSKAKDGEETERGSSYVYVKTFVKPDGSRYYYFISVTVSRDGKEVVISNQEKRKSVLTNLLLKGKLVWKHADDVSTASDVADGLYSSQGNLSDPITEGTDAPQTNNSTSESRERIGENQGKSEENAVISSEEDIDVTAGRVMEIPDAGDRSALVSGLLASAKAEEKSVSRVKNKVDPRNTQAFLAEQQRIRGEQDKARAEVAYWEEVKRIVEESNATESAPAETSKVKAARPKSIRERISALGEVLNLRDYILRALATGEYKFIWGDNRNGTKGLGSHLGFGNNRRGIEERQRRIWLLNNEEGLYPEQVAERLYANIQAEYPYLAQDDVEVFNEMLDVLRYDSAKDMVSEAEDMRRRREEMYEEYDSDQAMYDATMQERDERVDAENEAYRRELESQESGTPAEGRAAEPLGDTVVAAEAEVNTNPTEKQKEAKYAEMDNQVDEAENIFINEDEEDTRYRRGEDGVQGVRRTQESEMEREVRGFGERMADRFGGGVRLVYSDEIADSEAHAEEKRRSKGYYDTATGEVVVVLDNNTEKGIPSVIEVAMTMMHEVVGHKGVRGLFGTKEDAFLDDVYRGMKARTKAEMESLYGGQLRRRAGESEDAFEARRRRLMADEYIARVAEEGNNPGLLRRVGAKVRGLLRALGVELAITDNDIQDILRRSTRELTRRKDRAMNVREDGDVRYRAAAEDYASVQDDASGEYAEALSAPMDISVADMMPIEAAENAQAAGLLRDVVNRFPDTKIAITDLSRVYAAAEVAEEEATEVRYRRGISFDTRGASHRDTDITGRRERSFGEKASRLKEKAGISLYDEQLKLKQLQGKVAEWLTGSRKGALDDRLLFYEAENQAGSIAMDRKVRFDNEYRERLFALRAEVFKALGNKVDDKYYFYAKTLNERTGVIGEEAMAANKATMFSHLLSEQHPGHDFPEGFFDPKEYGYEALQEYARKEGWIDSIEGYIADCESRMGEKLVSDIWGVIGEIAEYQLTTSMKKGLITRDHFDRLMYGRPLAELVSENLEKGLITEGQYRAFLATDFTADELVKAGFITREQREGLKRRYEYYLPLKGDSEPTTEEVADYERSRSRVSWQIKSVKGGNTRLVNDPVSRLLADVYASISYQEKMAWIQSMYHALRLAERQGKGAGDFAILDNWVVKDETGDYVPYVRYVEGEPVFTPTEQEIAKGEVERARNLPIETAIRVPEAVQGEHIVRLKHRGRTIHIYFRDPAVANAVNNHFVPRNVPKLMKGLRAAGGFMGKVYTQWNIFFSVRNLSKDFGEAAINNYVQYGGRYMSEYMVNYWRVMRRAGTTLRGAKRSLVPRNDYERRVEEFFKYGGEVSYTQIESYDKAIRDFERELKRSADKRGVVSVTEAGFVKIGEAVSAANKLIELNARLATFITSRERGYGLRQSIRDAKEVTVNFDRRGRNSMEFGSLFLFWNAGRQSNRRKWELMRENPGRFWTSRAAMGLLNVAQTYVLGSALAAVFGVDWEDYMTGYYDIPDYIRYNNIVVMSADGKVYRIPLSPAFAPYKTLVENIGEATYRTAFNDRDGRYDWGKGMADIVKSVSADLGDLTTWEAEGGKRLIGWAPAPTVPLLEAMCNVDFTGRPVYKVGNSATPGYKRAYAGTKDVYVEITEWLNRVSGGEEAYGSWVGRRANPGAVQHVVEGYLGGLIQVLSKFWNVPEALKGASYERLPFVDTFYYGDAEMLGEREVRDDIYDARRLVESYNDVRSNFRKTDEDYDGNPKTGRFLGNNESRIDELKDLLKRYDEVTEELKSEDSEAYRRELRLLRRSIVELTNEMEEY